MKLASPRSRILGFTILGFGILLSVGSCTSESSDRLFSSVELSDIPPAPNTSISWADARVASLVKQMTLDEKISQLQHEAPAIERLNLPSYNYWSEALHGILTNNATSFPSPIALSATWDPDLVYRVATAISDEARGINLRDKKGLTYWSPVINMLRDPRWGRYDESYGEDPYLMSRMGVAFVRGLQGDDPKYLKTVATPKHFALNNSEFNRHNGTSDVDEQLLFEYYLPAFAATVKEGKAFSVMAAYNRVNGVPAPANTTLLEDILRKSWGFKGYVVSDCDAIADIVTGHQWAATYAEASAKALLAGTDLNCGTTYPNVLGSAVQQKLLTEADIDQSLTRVLRARFLLGEFDPIDEVPYSAISTDVIESKAHFELALDAARKAIVLLKNESNTLPLSASQIKSIAVIGPLGDTTMLGSYSGTPSRQVSALAAITTKFNSNEEVSIKYAIGTTVTGDKNPGLFQAAIDLARNSDVALVFAGTNLDVQREELDRADWALPGVQQELIAEVVAANPKTILVLVAGAPLGIEWAKGNVPAILTTFYNGQEQGTAIADVLFGDYNPSGKLTTTWYKLDAKLPPIDDYDIRNGRTYLYYSDEPLYAFGHGLSYAQFAYKNVNVSPTVASSNDEVKVTVQVKNTGDRAGDEIVQLYDRLTKPDAGRPLQQLRRFSKIHLNPGEEETVTFSFATSELSHWDSSSHQFKTDIGEHELRVGASSADIRGTTRLNITRDTGATTGVAGNSSTPPDNTTKTPQDSATDSSTLSGSGCQCTTNGKSSSNSLLGLLMISLLLRKHRRPKS